MASCYICGASGANVRRWVPVARRTFVSFGTRGRPRFGGGGTTAPKTICHACDTAMDKRDGAVGAILAILFVAFVIFCYFNDPQKPPTVPPPDTHMGEPR